MDATDADGEWSDEELLRSGSQTGVSDDQDTGLSSGQDKCRPHRQKTDTSAGGSGSELPRPRHKNHHHRPSLGSLIKKMSSEHAQHVEEQYNSWNTRTSNSADIVCMPIVTSFPPTDDASAAVDYSSKLSSLPAGTPNLMTSAPDPVSAILDKIDAQIDAMDAKDMSVVPKLTSVAGKNSRLSKTSSSRSTQSGLNASGDTGVGSLHDSEFSDLDKSKINLAGSTEMLSEPNLTDGLTDDERARRLDSDIPSDLDSVAAQQIDIKFKEIMKKKKDSPDEAVQEMARFARQMLRRKSTGSIDLRSRSQFPPGTINVSVKDEEKSRSSPIKRESNMPPDLPLPPNSGRKTQPSSRGAAAAASQLGSKLRSRSATRPSATMLSTGYGTDNESVRTEEFETKFMSLLVSGGQGGLSDSDGGRSKPETPRRRPNSVPADTSKTSLSAPQPQTQRHHQPQLQQQPQLPVPGLAKEDEELLQKLARVANETRRSSSPAHSTSGHAPATSPAPIINRPRSVSPTRLSLQRYRTAENLRLNWENPGGAGTQRRQNQLFSWDDDFWKQTSRKSPQSVASSASTFEEVESLCFSRSSSDSFNSSLRNWDNRYTPSVGWAGTGSGRQMWTGGGGSGSAFYPGRIGATAGSSSSRRQRISRQSSTTSTSTSRSSAGAVPGGEDDLGEYQHRLSQDSHGRLSDAQSITGKLIESMEFLGSSGNLDLADKLYLEKIFHRVLGQNQSHKDQRQPPPQPPPLKSALKKQPRNYEQPDMLSGNEALLERLQRLRRKQLIQRESGSAPASATSSPVLSAKKDNFEKKRRKDLIIPDEEEPLSSKKPQWTPAPDRYNNFRRGVNDDRLPGPSNKNQSGDFHSKSSMISSMSSLSMENGSLRASPVGSTSPASPNNLVEQHPNLATFLSVNAPVQRFASFDSTATGSASEGAMNVFSQPFSSSHAERVLMGLGFGAAEGFLPERFLKDWYNKISRAHSESSSGGGRSISDVGGVTNVEPKDVTGRGLYHSKSVGQLEPTGNLRQQAASSQDKSSFRGPHVLQRHDSHMSSISSILDEAASYLPKEGDTGSRNERIGDYIAAHSQPSNHMPQGGPLNSRVHKMRQFASARQKSLPLHLETLTEEDELRIRKSGFDPFDKEARLQMFISDTMSSSGKSTNSEQSRCGSNQSESDSLSSCSEMIDIQSKMDTPEWQQASAYRKQQDQIPLQLQQTGKKSARKNRHLKEQKKAEPSQQSQSSSRKRKEKHDNQPALTRGDPNENDNGQGLSPQCSHVGSHLQLKTDEKDRSVKHIASMVDKEQGTGNVSPVNNVDDGSSYSDNVGNKLRGSATLLRGAPKLTSHQVYPINQSISITSGDSLEVADIMQYGLNRSSLFDGNFKHKHAARQESSYEQPIQNSDGLQDKAVGDTEIRDQKNPPLQSIEPAMVSIILEDVDQDTDSRKNDHKPAIGPQEGNHLHIPLSRCSSSSLSPIPQSPVTVIEVGQLDNQQDSLDTECSASSKDTDDEACSENSGKSRYGGQSRHRKQVQNLRLSPPSQKLFEHRRGSDHLVPQLSINDKPLESRRFSLDVPTVARLRRISEEWLHELNNRTQIADIEDDSFLPPDLSNRRGSSRRASFSEEKPIIINDFLASKSGSRSPSPSRKKSCLSQSSETSLESSKKRRGKSRDRRISKSVSPSKSPTNPLSLSQSLGRDRESPARRNSRHRHSHSHHHHYNYNDDDHGSFERHHCCCCHHECHNSTLPVKDKDNQHGEHQPYVETSTNQSHNEKKVKPLENKNIPVNNSTQRQTDAYSNAQVQVSPQNVSTESPFHSTNPFITVDQNEKQSPLQSHAAFYIPRSLESSPGSARSAFTFTSRSGSKGNLSLPGGSDYQSETDVDEFPSTVKLTLNQRPISSFTKNIVPGANPFRRNSSSSSLISLKGNGFNPNVLFSSTPQRNFGNLKDDDEKGCSVVHTISRAVQVSGNHLSGSEHLCSTHGTTPSHVNYFLAKDQATQCSADILDSRTHHYIGRENYSAFCDKCSQTHMQTRSSEHVHVFNKITQTGVTCYEVSSQTEWVRDRNLTAFQDTVPTVQTDSSHIAHGNQSTGIDYELNCVSDWEPNCKSYEKRQSTKYKNVTNFNAIDETIELIEAELLNIDARQKQKTGETYSYFQNNQDYHTKDFASLIETQNRNISIDKRVPERYAPSSWSDATRLSSYFENHFENTVTMVASNVAGSKKRRAKYSKSGNSPTSTKLIECGTNPVNMTSHNDVVGNPSTYLKGPNANDNTSDKKSNPNSQQLRPSLPSLQNISMYTSTTTCNSPASTVRNVPLRDSTKTPPVLQFTQNHLSEIQNGKLENSSHVTKSNQTSPERACPTVDSKDLIVKMYELQQDLTSYLKPCEGMYTEEDVKILQDGSYSPEIEQESQNEMTRGTENTEPVLNRLAYDFSIENANTSSGFGYLFYDRNKAKRRFSTPAVCDGSHWARTHSKLSRLKYQNNSHQNSLNSLDIEVDFMNAGELSGLSNFQRPVNTQVPTIHACVDKESGLVNKLGSKPLASDPSHIEINSEVTLKIIEDSGKDNLVDEQIDQGSLGKTGTRNEQNEQPTTAQERVLNETSHIMTNNFQLLSPCPSICSSNKISSEGRNTPEIVISPLGSVHTAFLTVPNSPQHLLLKARFPSVSSSPSRGLSPSKLEKCEKSLSEKFSQPQTACNYSDVSSKLSTRADNKAPHTGNILRGKIITDSRTSSVQESSTLGSLTDLSMSSLDKESTSDFSKTSMYPHLSLESVGDFVGLPTSYSALDELCDQDIGALECIDIAEDKDNLKLRRDLLFMRDQAGNAKKWDFDDKGECDNEGEGIDADSDSNASVAGSDLYKDVDDMEVMMHQSRIMRQNSSSTYSEPDLDLIDTFSNDSLPSSLNEDLVGNTPEAFLTVSKMSNIYGDDLLQVSDYGGHSPVPSPGVYSTRESSPDSITSASACKPERYVQEAPNPQNKKHAVSLQRRVLQKAFSESFLNTNYLNKRGCADQALTPNQDAGYENDSDACEEFLQHQRREGSRDNWDVVQALIESQKENQSDGLFNQDHGSNAEMTFTDRPIKSGDDIVEFENKQIRHSENVTSTFNDDSSGDECDKEITRITHSSFLPEQQNTKSLSNVNYSVFEGICQTDDWEIKDERINYVETMTNIDERSEIRITIESHGGEDEKNSSHDEMKDLTQPANTKKSPPKENNYTDNRNRINDELNIIDRGDIEMLEVFQNADLSVLKSAAGIEPTKSPKRLSKSPQLLQDVATSNECDSELACVGERYDGSIFIPRVVGVEFSEEEETRDPFLTLSDVQFPSAVAHDDLDSGLTEDLELVLSKSADEFDELTNSLLVKDANSPSGSGLLHTPLSQITEEDTQSDCSAGEACTEQRLKVWDVRNRFIYPDVSPEQEAVVKLPRPIPEGADIVRGLAAEPKDVFSKLNDLSICARFSSASRFSYDKKKISQADNHFEEAGVDQIETENTLDLMENDISTFDQEMVTISNGFNSQLYDNAAKHPNRSPSPDAGENNSEHPIKKQETASNLVFIRSTLGVIDQTHQQTTRILSPKSGIFKFAQALLEDAMEKAQAEHAERIASLPENTYNPTEAKPYSSKQIINSKTVERTLDEVGTVTTKVSTSTVSTRLNLNASSELNGRAEKNMPEEKHVSTKTLQIGDYRESNSNGEPQLDDDVFYDSLNLTFANSKRSIRPSGDIESPVSSIPDVCKSKDTIKVWLEGDDESFNDKEVDKEQQADSKICILDVKDDGTEDTPPTEQLRLRQSTKESLVHRDTSSGHYVTKKSEIAVGTISQRDQENSSITQISENNTETNNPHVVHAVSSISKSQRESFQEDSDFSVADLKSRVKAMLLIDYGNAPGSSDSSMKDEHPGGFEPAPSFRNLLTTTGSESSNASSSRLKRVKVTTMFSQASEDGGVAFMSSSIGDSDSEADKSPGSDFGDGTAGNRWPDDDSKINTYSPQRIIRTQLPQSTGLFLKTHFSGSKGGGGGGRGRKQLKSFKSRDSLLKLHQQTHVYSSAGSDSDSDLQSALRNQRQIRAKTKDPDTDTQQQQNSNKAEVLTNCRHDTKQSVKDDDRIVKKKSQYLNVEPDRRRPRRKLGSPEPNRNKLGPDDLSILDSAFPTEVQSANCVRRLSSSSGSSLGNSLSNPSTPKVIVQQPSEDAPVFAPQMKKIFVFPSRTSNLKVPNTEIVDSAADSNDNHLHSNSSSPTSVVEFSNNGMNKTVASAGPIRPRGPWGLRAHRPKRPQFLSPSAAARPSLPVTFAPKPDVTYTRQDDPTHPELAYLDIVSRMRNMGGCGDGDHSSTTTHDIQAEGASWGISPPSIIKTEFTDQGKYLKPRSSAPSLNLRNLGSPEPCILNETNDLDSEDTVEHLDLFPVGSTLNSQSKDPARPGLSVIISSDQSELENMEPDLEISWPSKSLSVASKDSGFDSQSQGSPNEMTQSHKFGSTSVRSIEIVQEEGET